MVLQGSYGLEGGNPLPKFSAPYSNSLAPKGLKSFLSPTKYGIYSPNYSLTFGRMFPQGSYGLEGGNPCKIFSRSYTSSPAPKGSTGLPNAPKTTLRHQENEPPPKKHPTIRRMGPQGSYGLEGGNPCQNFSRYSPSYLSPKPPLHGDAHPMKPPNTRRVGPP